LVVENSSLSQHARSCESCAAPHTTVRASDAKHRVYVRFRENYRSYGRSRPFDELLDAVLTRICFSAVSWYLGSRCFFDCVKSARQCNGMGSFFLERISSSVVLRLLCSHADSNGGSRTFLAWAQTAIAGMKPTVIVFGIIANLLGATAVIWLSVLVVQTCTGR
jgi:hypothetical protein